MTTGGGGGAPRAARLPIEQRERLHAEQVRLLYGNLPTGLFATVAIAAILGYVQWSVVDHPVLIGWVAAIFVITLGRYLLVLGYEHVCPSAAEARRWGRWFTLGTALSGAAWGSAGLLLFSDDLAHQVFVIFALAGMTAGAVVAFSALLHVALIFLIPVLGPLTVRLLIEGNTINMAMGLMAALFTVLMIATTRRMYETTRDSLLLRFENADLISVLGREKEAVEKLNTELLREIAVRARIEDGLRDSEARVRAVVENVLDGIITLDEHGRLDSLNPAAERLFGYASREIVGQPFTLLLPPAEREEYQDYIQQFVRTRKGKTVGFGLEIVGQRKDGGTFPMELGLSDMWFHRQRRVVGIVRDITERKKVERMKSQFIASVNHELRTPLTSVLGALGLLAEGVAGELSAKGKSLLAIASNNIERLVCLISDILDLDEIQAGKIRLDFRPLDLSALVERAVQANGAHAAALGVKLTLRELLPGVRVYGDPDRLMQVMNHLLANATRSAPANSAVEVLVKRRGARIRVSIVDQGPAVPEAQRDRVFQSFAQLETSARGSAVGLSIARAMVEKHAGRIGFDTPAAGGAHFYFDLPEWHDDASVVNAR
jgi:PAS domain S-box-containing protein